MADPEGGRLAQLVERLAGIRILVVGDAMLDHYVVGSVERISPEAPVPILRVEQEFDRVGGAANVAVNAVSLGADVELACLVGRDLSDTRDPDAERLFRKCLSYGFEPTFFRFLPCTIRKARMIAGRQQVLRVDWEHTYGRTGDEHRAAVESGRPWEPLPLPSSALDGRREALKSLIDKCDVILVSDYDKGMVDAALMQQLVACGKPVAVDPRPRNAELYRGVSLITPNRKEATEMLSEDSRRVVSGEELGFRLSEQLECDVLVTLGADGMCLVTRDGRAETIPARAKEVYDVTGAGDTVAAIVALGLGADLDLADAARIANAAAGIVVGHVGTASVTPEELRRALAGD